MASGRHRAGAVGQKHARAYCYAPAVPGQLSCVSVVPCRSRGELRMLAWLMARAKEDGATATTTTRRGPRWRSTMAVAGRVLGNVRLGGSGGWSAGRAASGPVSSAQEAASRMEPPDQRHPAQPTQMVFHARPSACPPQGDAKSTQAFPQASCPSHSTPTTPRPYPHNALPIPIESTRARPCRPSDRPAMGAPARRLLAAGPV